MPGDTLTLDVGGETVTRTPRSERPQTVVADAPDDVSVLTGEGNAPDSLEAMLAASEAALAERDRQLADTNRRAQQAADEARQARDAAARANQGRVQDRAALVASTIEAASADKASATLALRTARESGDFDAEVKAQEMLASALYRHTQATAELNQMRAGGAQQPVQRDQGQQQPHQPSEAAQRWLDSHPRYHTDRAYRAVAVGGHTAALEAGLAAGSQEYVDFIDNLVASVYGPNHGTGDAAPITRGQPMQQHQQQPSSTSSAGPSNRGGGGSAAGGGNVVQTLLGPVAVTRRGGQIAQVRLLPRGGTDVTEDWKEGATIAGMDLGEYVKEQVLIAEERSAGGTGGWVHGDGQISR